MGDADRVEDFSPQLGLKRGEFALSFGDGKGFRAVVLWRRASVSQRSILVPFAGGKRPELYNFLGKKLGGVFSGNSLRVELSPEPVFVVFSR